MTNYPCSVNSMLWNRDHFSKFRDVRALLLVSDHRDPGLVRSWRRRRRSRPLCARMLGKLRLRLLSHLVERVPWLLLLDGRRSWLNVRLLG